MKTSLKDRHLFGLGAAACAVCCAAPLVGLIDLAGAMATAATLAFAGVVFAAVVGGTSLMLMILRRRAEHPTSCPPVVTGPVDVTLDPSR